MTALLIVGAGGHGRSVANAALESGKWDRIAFLDDHLDQGGNVLGIAVLGKFSGLGAHLTEFKSAVVALGDAQRRLELTAACDRAGYDLASIVHPSASISRFATWGVGSVVLAHAVVNVGAVLGTGCIVNTGATVDHDCVLGDGVHVCPGAHLAGSVRVGACTWIGVGASVREGTVIGARVMVGAGAAVVTDVADGKTVVGVPARPSGSA